ncbi:MAG: hypothetical protein KDN22_23310 [Verrucomicrobiae bacterium]|nr:hypothetical protein [Verrucomicrobiae bacterium]
MNRKNYQMVWSGACALLCAILPALAMGQAGDPFIENLRVRNEVTSQAIEQSPLGGLLGVIRGDHLEGSSQRGSRPLFGGNQRRDTQSRNWRSAPAPETTGLSLRNPLEGKLGWGSPVPSRPAARQQQYRQPASQQQQRQMASAPKEGALNRFFAGLKQKPEPRPVAAPARRTFAPASSTEKSGGLFAFLRKDRSSSNDIEGDWSREAQRRTSARTASPQVAQLASVNPSTADSGGLLNRLARKNTINSWMGIPKEEEAPARATASSRQSVPSTSTTSEQRYVKSDRTGFHAVGKTLNANRPDLYLSRGTTVNVTNRGWNWSNVVLSDGRIGTVQTSQLSRTPIEAKPPRSASKTPKGSTSQQKETPERKSSSTKSNTLTNRKTESSSMRRSKEPTQPMDRGVPQDQPSRAALDAVLEPSLESLLDPGVEATLRELEDELLLPLPPEFPEDADTGAGSLPPLN